MLLPVPVVLLLVSISTTLCEDTGELGRVRLGLLLLLAGDVTGDWSPDPCFPLCTTDSALTSPPPDRGCIKTDCFDEPLCRE